MSGGFEVLGEELETHAGKVDGLAERLRTAVRAAQQVSMDNSAFGVICQPFALLLDPFEQMGVQALEQGAESVADTAGKVRDASSKYAEREGVTGTEINRHGESL
ncbi:ESX-1 secretion-associated protein [Amycolatopsis antarctica]|uniref:ESX-1 secretion-associated protein n=1 Tax=Amycolatopsis antarctica TaxID=1854586 RepID=A0A263D5S8_9PSEU|nr:type VII secretion target [Amycolatopsis antarctica]OZM73731.1 ESX-1 secretion-associated protein [Amycolatopsis antarctica]